MANEQPKAAPKWDEKEFLVEAKRGTPVRLIEPMFDNYRIVPAGVVIPWPYETPPTRRQAMLEADASPTPASAPAMTSGKPPADAIDPLTGQPFLVPAKGQV